jgi:hydroxypyruvate reductase
LSDPRRGILLELYAAGCEAVDGRRRVRAALSGQEASGLWLVAVGKAASGMALGALDVLGNSVARGLVISRPDHLSEELHRYPQIELLAGGHPLPDAHSLAAGARMIEFARAAPAGSPVLVLVSGGASALVEALPPGLELKDLVRITDWGLAHGLDISELNAVRRRISCLKDGRYAALLAHTRARALVLSDVPDDSPATVGSGLVAQSPPGGPSPELPPWLLELLPRVLPPQATLPATIIGCLSDALAAAARAAESHGLAVARLPGRAEGDVMRAAHQFAHALALADHDVLLWGGETTVTLPERPGRGGRNQQFALAVASRIAGHPLYAVLAAGTDGTDGNTLDAGAIVDGETVARANNEEIDVEAALAGCDAGTALEASGDLLNTGPTGTNVGDLVIGLRLAASDAASVTPSADPGPEPML